MLGMDIKWMILINNINVLRLTDEEVVYFMYLENMYKENRQSCGMVEETMKLEGS